MAEFLPTVSKPQPLASAQGIYNTKVSRPDLLTEQDRQVLINETNAIYKRMGVAPPIDLTTQSNDWLLSWYGKALKAETMSPRAGIKYNPITGESTGELMPGFQKGFSPSVVDRANREQGTEYTPENSVAYQNMKKAFASAGGRGTPGSLGGGNIDDMINQYLSGMTEGLDEAQLKSESAVEEAWKQAEQKALMGVKEGRHNLDTGGYLYATQRASKEALTGKLAQLADIATKFAQLKQTASGTALGTLTSMRGQNIDWRKYMTDLNYRKEVDALRQQNWQKEFEEGTKRFTETLGLQKSAQDWEKEYANLQRGWSVEDWAKQEALAKELAKMTKSSTETSALAGLFGKAIGTYGALKL